MEYLEAKINQLVVERPGKQKTFIRSFATKPSKAVTGKLGKIFGLIEIGSTHPQIPSLIDLIVEEIKNNYYQLSNIKTKDEEIDINERFEAALKKTNLAIAAFLENEQISLDLEKINAVIAVIFNSELHFTFIGRVGAILLYNLARNNYRIINILETSQSPEIAPHPLKFFSQIISGRVKPKDILFITTTNVLDYFSLERIKNIITNQPLAESTNELKKLLEETGDRENFGALALELGKVALPPIKPTNIQQFDYRQAASGIR